MQTSSKGQQVNSDIKSAKQAGCTTVFLHGSALYCRSKEWRMSPSYKLNSSHHKALEHRLPWQNMKIGNTQPAGCSSRWQEKASPIACNSISAYGYTYKKIANGMR